MPRPPVATAGWLSVAPMMADGLGVDGAAFRIAPDLRFLFPEPSHEAAFAAALGAMRAGSALVVVRGETGTGKTLLLKRIESELRRTGAYAAYVPYAKFGPDDLLACIGPALGFPSDAPASPSRPPARRVALIDDAENVPGELLAGLDGRAAALGIQIVLAGGPRLDGAMADAGQEVTTRVQIEPLQTSTVADYVAHRLHLAGGVQVDAFSPEAIAAIAHYSRGIPRLINQVCGRALVLANKMPERVLSLATVAEAIRDCPALALSGKDGIPPAPTEVIEIARALPTDEPPPQPTESAPTFASDATAPSGQAPDIENEAPGEPSTPEAEAAHELIVTPPPSTPEPVALPAIPDRPDDVAPAEQKQPERPRRIAARRPKPPASVFTDVARAAHTSRAESIAPAGQRPRYAGFVPIRPRPAPTPDAPARTELAAAQPQRRSWAGMVLGIGIVVAIGTGYTGRAHLIEKAGPAVAKVEAMVEHAAAAARAAYAKLARSVRSWTGRDGGA